MIWTIVLVGGLRPWQPTLVSEKPDSRPTERLIPPRVFSDDPQPYAHVHLSLSFADQDKWQAHAALNGFCVFYAGRYVKARGHAWKRANTNEGVYIYCTAGKGYFRCDGKEWTVAAGDLLYAFPFTNHGYGASDSDPWSIYWMHVAGPEVTTYSSLLGFTRDRPVVHVGRRPRAVAVFQTLFQFLKPPLDERKMAIVAGAARLLLASMLAEDRAQPTGDMTVTIGIQRVLEAMQERLDRNLSIADWMEVFGGSRSHFQRQFKHFTGHGPHEYFLRLKIQKACSLLAGSDLRVSEIASRVGFSDPLYFSRLFHRLTGHTAGRYRILARR